MVKMGRARAGLGRLSLVNHPSKKFAEFGLSAGALVGEQVQPEPSLAAGGGTDDFESRGLSRLEQRSRHVNLQNPVAVLLVVFEDVVAHADATVAVLPFLAVERHIELQGGCPV